jgi:hypothetical protein
VSAAERIVGSAFPVMVVEGLRDTRLKAGRPYGTRLLAEVLWRSPTRLPKNDALAFVPSTYAGPDGRNHRAQTQQGSFVALCGDVDKGDHPLAKIADLVRDFCDGAAFRVYSTAHARSGDMRWRIVVPLAEPLPFKQWRDAQTVLFDFMEGAGVAMDASLGRAGQIIFLPNVPDAHSETGEILRGDDGEPLYFEEASSLKDAPGLRLDTRHVAAPLAAVRQQRQADDRLRETLRQQALRKPIVSNGGESLIDAFNASNGVADLLARYGYEQSRRDSDDWRSQFQTSGSFATRVIDGCKWVSLSASDTAQGLGAQHRAGCYGDAFDLFVHFEHGGDRTHALRTLRSEQRANNWKPGSGPANDRDREERTGPVDDVDPGDEQCREGQSPRDASGNWPEPVDLWVHYSAPELPTGLLPDVIERFARKHGEVMGADPAGLAMAALTVCATAITDDITLQVKKNDPTWKESSRLWVALVGQPSRKKSPIFKAAMRPLRRLDSNLMSDYLAKLRDYEALPNDQRKGAPKPKQKRLLISDATVEAAQEVMKDSPDGILSEQDELSGWFGAMDKFASGKGSQADRAFYLKSYNGGTYNLNRIARGAMQIPNLSINLLGGIQPEPLRKIANDSVDDGLIQRLLPVILRPASVGRDVPADGVIAEYERLIESLVLMRPPQRGVIARDELSHSVPIRFDDRARAIREQLEVEHLALVEALETVSPKLAAHYGKFDGLFARLCLLWQCIENAAAIHPPGEIPASTAERVAKFMETFIRPSAVAFYAGMLGLSAGHEDLIALASWIVAKGLPEVKARDAQSSTQSLRHLTAEEVRTLCEKMESFGWLERGEPAPKSNTPRWIVNPRVHELFGERAGQEQERRTRAREALRDALQV